MAPDTGAPESASMTRPMTTAASAGLAGPGTVWSGATVGPIGANRRDDRAGRGDGLAGAVAARCGTGRTGTLGGAACAPAAPTPMSHTALRAAMTPTPGNASTAGA